MNSPSHQTSPDYRRQGRFLCPQCMSNSFDYYCSNYLIQGLGFNFIALAYTFYLPDWFRTIVTISVGITTVFFLALYRDIRLTSPYFHVHHD